jgi:hypothetical protein
MRGRSGSWKASIRVLMHEWCDDGGIVSMWHDVYMLAQRLWGWVEEWPSCDRHLCSSLRSSIRSLHRGSSQMAGVLTAVILGWGIGGRCLWKIWRGYDSALYFTTTMAVIAGCAFYILVQ